MTERYPMLPPAADTLDSLSAQRPPGDLPDETPPGDPIFAAIQACRTAKQESDAAYARVNSLHALAKKRFGAADQQRGGRHAYIKRALGCDEDAYTEGPTSALWNAYGAFAETVPTTLAGLFAMLIFADQITDHDRDALGVTIFSTFATAAKAIDRAGAAMSRGAPGRSARGRW
jgi:hypothetical protein